MDNLEGVLNLSALCFFNVVDVGTLKQARAIGSYLIKPASTFDDELSNSTNVDLVALRYYASEIFVTYGYHF